MKDRHVWPRPSFFWYDTDLLKKKKFYLFFFYFIFFFFFLMLYQKKGHTRPSYGVTPTPAIRDLFAWRSPNGDSLLFLGSIFHAACSFRLSIFTTVIHFRMESKISPGNWFFDHCRKIPNFGITNLEYRKVSCWMTSLGQKAADRVLLMLFYTCMPIKIFKILLIILLCFHFASRIIIQPKHSQIKTHIWSFPPAFDCLCYIFYGE